MPPESPGAESVNSEKAHFSPAEFARYSGLSIATIRRYLASGKLPKIQPGGPHNRVLIPRDALSIFRPSTAALQNGAGEESSLLRKDAVESPSQPPKMRGPSPRWRNGA